MSDINSRNGDLVVIEPGSQQKHYWDEIWRYRELFIVLAWRDLAVRYKQTTIGITWVILQPFLTMLIFTFVFGKIANLSSPINAPYALLVLTGLLPWQLFSNGFVGSSASLVENSNLISKIYFPRLIIPAAAMVVAFVDFMLGFIILVGVMFWYNYVPGWQILTLPVLIILALFASIGPGLWLTSLNVKYRDFRYVIPFIVQVGLYISPIGFSPTIVPEQWRLFYYLNPIVGVVDGFRWAILGGEIPVYLTGMTVSLVVSIVWFFFGMWHFKQLENSLADLI